MGKRWPTDFLKPGRVIASIQDGKMYLEAISWNQADNRAAVQSSIKLCPYSLHMHQHLPSITAHFAAKGYSAPHRPKTRGTISLVMNNWALSSPLRAFFLCAQATEVASICDGSQPTHAEMEFWTSSMSPAVFAESVMAWQWCGERLSITVEAGGACMQSGHVSLYPECSLAMCLYIQSGRDGDQKDLSLTICYSFSSF